MWRGPSSLNARRCFGAPAMSEAWPNTGARRTWSQVGGFRKTGGFLGAWKRFIKQLGSQGNDRVQHGSEGMFSIWSIHVVYQVPFITVEVTYCYLECASWTHFHGKLRKDHCCVPLVSTGSSERPKKTPENLRTCAPIPRKTRKHSKTTAMRCFQVGRCRAIETGRGRGSMRYLTSCRRVRGFEKIRGVFWVFSGVFLGFSGGFLG